MAPGRGHVDVNERRLRPIYDCLDNGNNKKAIQEAEKVLRKQKDFLCAKALKALALLRLGRQPESEVYLREVHDQHPTDEATLQAMSICYRELNKLPQIADLYHNAHTARPDNEDILSALFMAYVRINDYKKQQQTAMKLHKLRPAKNPYYFWAIMSLVMQAHTDPKLAGVMFLPLADKMVTKYVEEEKVEAEAEVLLYLIILKLREKYKEALELLQGPLAEKISSELQFKQELEAELYCKLEDWPKASAAYKKMLQDNPDQWNYYQEYFRLFFKLVESKWEPAEGEGQDVDHTVEKIAAFLQQQVENAAQSERGIRGPYLAPMEFIKMLRQQKMEGEDKIGNVEDLMKLYVVKYANKPCCFNDVKPYLDLVGQETMKKMVAELVESGGWNNPEKLAGDTKELQSHLCLLQLQRYLGVQRQLDTAAKQALIDDLVKRHEEGLKFGENLLPTDIQFSDNYLLLAVHLLYDIYLENSDPSLIWRAIVLLENGLKKSPANFQFKFLLIKLYCLIGVFALCRGMFDSMEVKHIQHDAISYMLSHQGNKLGHVQAALHTHETIAKFFTYNYKDASEYLVSAYKYGAFAKINELVEFRERLQHSVQYANATVERMMLELLLEPKDHSSVENVVSYFEINPDEDVSQNLRDNRDLGVMLSWDSDDRTFTDDKKQQSFDEEVQWIHVRQHTLHCLCVAVSMGASSNSPTNGTESAPPATVLHALTSRLSASLKDAQGKLSAEGWGPVIQGPDRPRLYTYVSLGLGDVLLDALMAAMYVHDVVSQPQEKGDAVKNAEKEELLKSGLCSRMKDMIKTHRASPDKSNNYPDTVEKLVLIAETVGELAILCGVCHRLVSPLKAAAGKKTKKKKGGANVSAAPLPSVIIDVGTLIEGVAGCCEELKEVFTELHPNSLEQQLNRLSVQTQDTKISEEDGKALREKFDQSYKLAETEMTGFLSNHLTYLRTLKLS